MPTCVVSAGDDRLWKGVGEKKQVQQSGAMRTGLLDGKNSCYPGYFYSSLSHFLKKKGTVSLFPGAGFSGLRSVWGGGGTSYPRDRLSPVLLFFLFFFPSSFFSLLLLGLVTAGEGSCALPFAF